MSRVLVACEYSGVVRDAFRSRGHSAMSCDLLPTDAPGPHYQGDVRDILSDGWDLMVAHPDCTYLCSSGLHWNTRDPERAAKTEQALDFVRDLLGAPIRHIALENPVGCISTRVRPCSQYIQPYEFGHNASKKTGLWLKNLPLLQGTRYVPPRWVCCGERLPEGREAPICPICCGQNRPLPRWGNQTDSGQNRLAPSPTRWKERARTYEGWAEAMAEQWGWLL